MVIWHAFVALLAGFATMAAILMAAKMLLDRLAPAWSGKPDAAYLFVNLGFSFLAAAGGGFVTAWMAPSNPLGHIVALSIAALALSALSLLSAQERQPLAYQFLLVIVTPAGVIAGGLLRLRLWGWF